MFRSLKKIASVVMATAMAVTTAVPGTAIVANAETTTIKTRVKNSDKKQNTINAADMNKLSINTENATVTYSSSLATDNAAARWAKKEMKDSEKPKLGTPIAGKLDASKINDSNNGYWIKYSGVTLDGAEKGQKYDLKVSVEQAHGAISGADGPYIAFHKKTPASIRYSGYQWIVVTYTLTDAGKSTLGSTWKGNMTFGDIDSYQGLEIRTPGRVTWAGLKNASAAKDDTALGFNMPADRLPSGSVKDNTVYCDSSSDATDGGTGSNAQRYALYVQAQLTPANNKMKIRYFTGGKDGKQPNGVFLSFDARNRSGDSPTIINFPLTKTVNGKTDVTLSNSSDSFEYTLSTTCGNAVGSQIKSFIWKDTLESVLEFTGNPTVTRVRDGKTENVTSNFTIKTNGQILTATANKLTDDEMRGKFTLHFHAKVKAGANLSKYLNADKTEVVIPNKGTLTTKQDSGTKTNTSNTVNVRMKMAKLAVDKVVDKYEHKVGDNVVFTITTKETGKTTNAANVNVTDTIPSEYKIASVKTEGIEATSSFSGQNVKVTAASLPAGKEFKTIVTCTALESGNAKENYNTAKATATNAMGAAQDDAEAYTNGGELSIDKVVDKYEYEVGDTANFTVKVKNNKGIAKNVTIADTLPEGLELVSGSLKMSGVPDSVTEHVAGTADPTNKLNPELRNETATSKVTSNIAADGNGYKATISALPKDAEVTITFSAKTTKAGNGKEIVNIASAKANNADEVKDDAELYINTADLSIAKKYINEYKAKKKDNRADNEFRVYEEETGNELVKYQVDVTSNGADGTVAKDVDISDISLPDGLILNYDDIQIVETTKDGKTVTFKAAGGKGTTIKYHVAGTADETNKLNPDKYNETEDRTPEITLEKSGNGWKLKDTYLASGSKLTITYTGKATEIVNGTEVRNTAKATASNLEKTDGKAKTVKADALVYINSPRLVITKKADKEKYAIGDTVTYKIDVTNSQIGTVARNLVIDDDIQTEGVKLQKASIVLMDAEGNVIKKESYDEAVKNNTFALKTKRHLVKEGNYSLWDLEAGKKPETQKTWNPVGVTKETKLQIEYQMVITDNKLAGKEIKNVANAVSDEALKVTTDATVTPNGPSITPNKDSDKATYYLGEESQYTITARQSRENVTAEKVIIKDQFDQKDNFLIKEGSFHVTFNGNDITKDVKITLNEAKDGFTIETGKDLTEADTIKVTYRATPQAASVGKETTNSVLIWGSNAPQVLATNRVKTEPVTPELSITKKSDKSVYSIGETGHYTVVVRQTKKNATAENVVIADAMQVAGTKISNVKIMKGEKDITEKAEISVKDGSYSINTNENLAKDETFTITYDALFESDSLDGKKVKNIADAKADNADEVKADNEVTLHAPNLTITKSSDKKVYNLSETGHYTVKVTQDKKDAEAINVRINDALQVKGVSIVKDSVKIADTTGKDITKDVKIETKDDSYSINTGRNLAYGESFTVTYDVVFKDASLANKDIPNVAEAVADNAKAETDNTVTPVDIEDGLTAIKTANPESGSVVNTGNEITYNITVTNTSKEDKKNVMIRDMVPELTEYVSGGTLKTISGKSYVTFLVDTLKAGESKTESFKVKVTGTGLATIKNVAQVKTSDEPDKHWEDDDFVDTNKVIHTIPYIVTEVVPALSIEKSSDKETYSVGDTGHYTVKVSETEKDAAAKDVIIKDAIENNAADILTDTIKITDPDGKDITKEVEIKSTKSGYTIKTGKDLSYGKAFTVTYDVKFTKASVANEKVRNVAKATAGNLTTTTTKDVTPGTYKDENGNALFEIVKDSDPANGSTVNVGDDIKYSIKVKNTSEKDISNIHILDAVPTGTTYKDGGDVKDINGVSYVAFTIDTLKAGEEKTVSFTVTVNESADKQVANKALVKVTDKDDDTDLSSYQETNEVTHPLPSWVEDDNEVTVIAPSLTIQKASDKDVYQVGETGHYTVTVGQDTENAVAKNVVIKDALQVKGAEIQTATIKIVDTNGKDITNKVDNITKDTSGYTIETGRDLAFGETFTVTYDVLFKDGSLAGQAVKNIAKAKADNASAKTDNDVTPVTVEDGLTALKSAEPASGTQVKAGDEITYNIEVTNTSNEEKKNVLVLDAVPDKTTYVEGSGGKLVEISGKSYVSFTVPSVAAGASESVSFKVKVADTVTDDDVITNVALVKKADKENPKDPSSWTPDSFVPTNEVKHPTSDWVETEKEVTVDGPEMAIEKTSDKIVYGVGETGHYTVKLSQTKENAEAKNVIIEDALQTEGAEILSDTIKVLDTKGTDITKSVQIATTKTSYTIKTGMNLAKDESFTVNYDVKFTSKSLVGKKVKNIAIGKADTGEVTTDHEVDVDKGTNPRLVVKKTSDKDSYKVGGQGQYTITVTNDRKGTVAKNVVIKDALQTTGTVIDEKSIKVTGPDGKEIKKATIKMTKNGFTVKTKSNLEGEKSMKVTYKVTFKDASLAGKNVKNVATATSDNTKPGKSTKTVKVTKATPKKSTPKKSSGKSSGNSGSGTSSNGGSNGTSKTVKTSDIIFMALIGAAVVFCVSGVVYVIKKRKRI